MHHTHRRTVLVGTALATMALTFSSIGVVAQDAAVGVPAAPTGYAELDEALAGAGEAESPYTGTKVSIQTQWVGGEGANFQETLAAFETATGIDVQFDEIGSSHETVLLTRIAGNAPPDLAVQAQPSAVVDFGATGDALDLTTIMDGDKLRADFPATIGLYTSGDAIYGLPYKVDVKGVIWYPIEAFAAAGYEIPATWDDLIALSDQIVNDGGTPWCIGIESGTATGWQQTDWVEEVLLRQVGTEIYDAWIAGDVKFNSPEIKAAWDAVGDVWFKEGNVFGGTTAIVATSMRVPMDPMFDAFDEAKGNVPGCWFQNIPFWYGPDFFPDKRADPTIDSQWVVGEDIGIFGIPPIDPAKGVPALGSGDGLMVFNDRPEVRAVAQFLALPEGIETWARKGSAIGANQNVPADWYEGNYKTEVAAGVLAGATSFSFDASDLMPPNVGLGTFWSEATKWIQAGGENTEQFLQAIDDSWPAE